MSSPYTTPRVEQTTIDELPCWRIHTEFGEALIAQQGAQLLSYQPHEQPPLVWLSEQTGYKRGQSLRGGVPVCWPWFGDLARNPVQVRTEYAGDQPPAHGLVRGIDWQLDDIADEQGALAVHWKLDARQGLPGWAPSAELSLVMRFGERLGLELTTRNLGDKPLALSQALHTYFAVSDVRQVSIDGLQGCRYIETLENWEERRQDGLVRIQGETDRIYLDVDRPLVIRDPQWQRGIHIQTGHSRSAVLWNPWVDKAQRLSQFADDAWQRMLCIETARVWDDVLSVAPGRSETMSVEIWSEGLEG
ncbi:D-hexose-6-phosphate mutarotase [Pseudomonas citronellolis]|uniref:D-hexose-6-phosphate mutarotase n=1 Tax=Pseudomonas citronellolis TaxID=53408 RepID=UPI00209DDEF2|nr:D-hexose-6-phosphate mutarotase [Pseudomonas citronellolis]MCP1607594.1 glucose-6-phosphate 1-epimerase [Pseudomonas citronellolis]MCP1641055.1 glucose-6-phosphate 1-epimerase [Pseudomonas citronellolis]MCP1658549.1 glucose-6-phosphate 1-epimerase [Pseudomonas citronellolis]MCP1663973.1 glucose-6-phosphate 1-epimerase [Pseudomonas citronellolis]MCP1700642.1 glucose-6-phosphate 1-epimerase [Pseudomonas citronellolis]